ncbi:hypothetical protein [Pseudomonas sp. BRG-100]|uniref:hypothetical protein n=1 Tax=Pseudomonas sp. BRG-100 TaxID=1524267 RepID=UPI0013DFD340|nr:hypothetical protein [Pseudomonas sp. BRG-100]
MRRLTDGEIKIISGGGDGQLLGELIGGAIGSKLGGNGGAVVGGYVGNKVGGFVEGLSNVKPSPGIPIMGIPPMGSLKPFSSK